MPNVYTGGTFDLFHAGHVQFLQKCERIAKGGEVVVSLNPDGFISKFKGRPPIMSFMERWMVLNSCVHVDRVVVNISGQDSKPTILSVMPDIIVIGDDWLKKDYHKQMGFTPEWLDENGIELKYVPYTKNISTTIVKERVCQAFQS